MVASKLQKHFLKLLCELDELCVQQGVAYSLAEHSAWDAVKFHEYHGGMYDTCVMMTEEAVTRFKDALVSADVVDRLVVADGVGAREGRTVRYVDTSVTLYDFKAPERFKYPTVGVDIRILKDAGSGCYSVVNPKGDTLKLPKSLFDSYTKAVIDGYEFSIVEDLDGYLSVLVSKDWRSKTYCYPIPKEPTPEFNLIFVDNLPYGEFFARPFIRKVTSPFAHVKRALYNRWRKRCYDGPANAFEKKYKKYLSLTEDRFILWERLYPVKQEFLELAVQDPQGEELRERLAPYFEAVDKHKKQGLGITFDEDILQIALPILKAAKGDSYVRDFLAVIPAEHRAESIDALLRRKGVDHPLLADES